MANVFLLAGVIALGVWAWSLVSNTVFQHWANWTFDREIRGQPTSVAGYLAELREKITGELRIWLQIPPTPEPPQSSPRIPRSPTRPTLIDKDGLIGRLMIPRLHLSAIVREGADGSTLQVALGHIPGTSLPGQNGNVGIAGHRDTLFRDLRRIRKCDLILFDTFGGKYTYVVKSTEIVRPKDVSVLKADDHPELTLVTCYPFYYVGSAPKRFIVKARQLYMGRMEVSTGPSDHKTDPRAEAGQSSEPAASSEANYPAETSQGPNPAGMRKIAFEVTKDHNRRLSSEISIGLTGTDVTDQRVNGWIWVMPDRRTIWLRNQKAREPLIFYPFQDGRERRLVITSVARKSVRGYLLLPEGRKSSRRQGISGRRRTAAERAG
jgi:sortase A